jgi:hypothetical protein
MLYAICINQIFAIGKLIILKIWRREAIKLKEISLSLNYINQS